MKLTRSADRKVFSLTNFDPNHPSGQYFYIKAWYSMLKPFNISEQLMTGLNKYYEEMKSYFFDLIEVQFVCNCNFLLLTYIET